MTTEERIEEIREQLKVLNVELWDLVVPTEDELQQAADNYRDFLPDVRVYWMMLSEGEFWVQELHMVLDVCNQRDPAEEEDGD